MILPIVPRTPQGKSPADFEALPVAVHQRLKAAGVRSLDDWRRLTPVQRQAVWGITSKMAAQIDALAVRS